MSCLCLLSTVQCNYSVQPYDPFYTCTPYVLTASYPDTNPGTCSALTLIMQTITGPSAIASFSTDLATDRIKAVLAARTAPASSRFGLPAKVLPCVVSIAA